MVRAGVERERERERVIGGAAGGEFDDDGNEHPSELGALGDEDSTRSDPEDRPGVEVEVEVEEDGYHYDPGLEYVDNSYDGPLGRYDEDAWGHSRSPSPIVYARPDSRGNLSSTESSLGSPNHARGVLSDGEEHRVGGSSSHRRYRRDEGDSARGRRRYQRHLRKKSSSASSLASSFRASSRRSSMSSTREDVPSSTDDSIDSVGKNRRRRVRTQLRSYRNSYRAPTFQQQPSSSHQGNSYYSSSNPASNVSHEDVGRGRGMGRGFGGGGKGGGVPGTPDTGYSSRGAKGDGGGDGERKGRSSKRTGWAAVARAFEKGDEKDKEKDKEREREKEREKEREQDKGELLDSTLFRKKVKARGGGVPPITTSTHAQGIVAPSPIGASPAPHHQLGTVASNTPTNNPLLEFAFPSSKKKGKKVPLVDERPGTAESSSGRSSNHLVAGLWPAKASWENISTSPSPAPTTSGTGSAAGSVATGSVAAPFMWVSKLKPTNAAQQARMPPHTLEDSGGATLDIRSEGIESYEDLGLDTRSSSPALYTSLKTPAWGSMAGDDVVDISSRGSSRSRAHLKERPEQEELGASPKGRRKSIKKRTASVPTIPFEEVQQTMADVDARYRELSRVPFETYDREATHQPAAYDSDAAVLSITSRRKGKEVMRSRDLAAEGETEMNVAQAIPALRSLKTKSSGQMR
ncbi:hypothetical protein MD484_g3682, partial [Candolleomyces efflorescens]